MSSYLTSSSSLGRTGSLESKLCGQSPVRDAELGYSLFLPSHQHTQPVVRGQRRVDNLVCRDQPSEHRQDRRKPRKGIASPGNKLMWKPVYKDGHSKSCFLPIGAPLRYDAAALLKKGGVYVPTFETRLACDLL